MAMCSIHTVKQRICDIIDFLLPVHSLANSHIVNFITGNIWYEFLPLELQNELKTDESFIQLKLAFPKLIQGSPSNEMLENCPNTFEFLNKAKSLYLHGEDPCITKLATLHQVMCCQGSHIKPSFTLTSFMSEKKLHEVKVSSQVVDMLCSLTGSDFIVDIGGGKGYLSTILAMHYNLSVLGVDSSSLTTCGAVKMSQKLVKYWTDFGIKDQNKINNKKTNKERLDKQYKQVTTFVTNNMDLSKLVSNEFEDSGEVRLCIAGLHTCGNLAPSCLKMFTSNNQAKCLLNVGCCYHFIEEEFERHFFWDNVDQTIDDYGFPMSQFLQSKKLVLGRNARMMAAHSMDRLVMSFDKQFSIDSIFYRAVLQSVVENARGYSLQEGQIKRLNSKCSSFHEYMKKALKILDVNIDLSEDEITQLYVKHLPVKAKIESYFLLKLSLAPVVEALILLDRLLYLLEEGSSQAYLVPLFDPVTSPRGFGIVAWKLSHTKT